MNSRRGVFIAIESTDSTSRVTQYELLKQRLYDMGYEAETFSFPRHGEPSSYFVAQYLEETYGSVGQVGPYTASLFFALDRYDVAPAIRAALGAGKVVLADRFVGSNMAHQGAKLRHAEERRGFFIWLDNLEFQTLEIPRPDLNLVLRAAPQMSDSRLTDITKVYDDMCQLFPKDFSRIDCVRNNQPVDQATINNLLWEKIVPLIPPPITRTHSTPATAANNSRHDAIIGSIDEGPNDLSDVITNVQSNVYAFKGDLAAIEHLIQEGGDVRTIIKESLAYTLSEDKRLLKYTKSTALPVNQCIVVEQASALLAKELERSRLATYVEQPTLDISRSRKDENGRHHFYTPERLDPDTKSVYIKTMRDIFKGYSMIVNRLNEYLEHDTTGDTQIQASTVARLVLPLAATTTIGIQANAELLEKIIARLARSDLQEANKVGQEIRGEIRKITLAGLEQVSQSLPTSIYRSNTRIAIKKIVDTYLPHNHGHSEGMVKLTTFWPHNELDIIADMLYEFSDQPLGVIQEEIDKWSYAQKIETFQTYIGERLHGEQLPGRALEKVHYSWDILWDYATFRDLQRHGMVDALEWQTPTPRYGYELPVVIEKAGLTDEFEACFDRSLKLYSVLQQAGYMVDAQYATLFGHRMRWTVTLNGREALRLLGQNPRSGSLSHRLLHEIREKIAEVHPTLAMHINSVNSKKS